MHIGESVWVYWGELVTLRIKIQKWNKISDGQNLSINKLQADNDFLTYGF